MASFKVNIFLSCVALTLVSVVMCQDVTDSCLGCICEASSGCKKDIGCTDAGVCGPLLISWAYWADGGKWTVTGSTTASAYSDCSSDLYCAGQTVRSYMEKYKKDCNGDGKIDCQDFAAIHKQGPHNCENPNFQTTPFYTAFSKCIAQVGPQ